MNDVQRCQCPCLRSGSQVFSLRTAMLRKRRPAPAATDDVHLCDIYIQLGKSGMQIIRIRLSKREQDASL